MSEQDISKTIGANIRYRRKLVGMTIQQLAAQINVSYQQLQKYESGKDRVSAPTLFILSQILQTGIAGFFGAAESPARSCGANEVVFLTKAYNGIKSTKLRQAVRQLIRVL